MFACAPVKTVFTNTSSNEDTHRHTHFLSLPLARSHTHSRARALSLSFSLSPSLSLLVLTRLPQNQRLGYRNQGATWIKPQEIAARDKLIKQFEVTPVLERLKKATTVLVGVILVSFPLYTSSSSISCELVAMAFRG